MQITATIPEFDRANKNNRIYPKETAINIVNSINCPDGIYGTIGVPGWHNANQLDQISHVVSDAKLDEDTNTVTATITTLNTRQGTILEQLITAFDPIEQSPFGFRPTGDGTITDDQNITNYRLISVDAVLNPA